jgi:SAM-dependent methyltransferase
MKDRNKCKICDGKLNLVYDLGEQPLANNLNITSNQISKKYPLALFVCKECTTFQHKTEVSLKILYSKYYYSSSVSKGIVDNAEVIAGEIKKKFRKNKKILEIGSNDGYLLNLLKENFFCVGIDPSTNMCKLAKKKNLRIENKFFNKTNADYLLKKYGKFDIIIANNVLAHNPNIKEIILSIKKILSENGLIIIEFQDSSKLLTNALFDMIYHEHFFYFDKFSFFNLLAHNNFKCTKLKYIKMHGGSFRVYAKQVKTKSKIKYNKNIKRKIKKFREKGKKRDLIVKKFFKKNRNKKIFIYGAAAKTTVFINHYKINKKKVKYVIDDTIFKQKKYIPNTKIKIMKEDMIIKDRPDYIIIGAWNYYNYIKKKLQYIKNWNGKIITFFPNYKIN